MKEKILIVEDEYIVADHLKRFLEKAGHLVCGIASSYGEALSLVSSEQPSWVLLDICLRGDRTGIDLAEKLSELDIPFIYLSANMSQVILENAKKTKPYGFMSKPFKDKELMIMLDIAMDRHARILEMRKLPDQSSGSTENLTNHVDSLEIKMLQFADALHSHINFDLLCINADRGGKILSEDIYILRQDETHYSMLTCAEIANQVGVSTHEYQNLRKVYMQDQKPSFTVDIAFKRLRLDWLLIKYLSAHFNLASQLSLPLNNKDMMPGITFFSIDSNGYQSEQIVQMEELKDTIKETLKTILSEKINKQSKVSTAKIVEIRERVDYSKAFEGIIGNSSSLISVLDQLKIVAPTSTSVLIMGESGTGKERIAQAVHELSPRKTKPFIIVNCAALPISLIESELFGHEKGAFTGAGERRIGKFEQADTGTIFLDEIGELPMESQVKLLRVIQEREIERIGGNQRKKLDVRIIAATNRNMEKEVAEGRFRLDLFYRLNVFPLELPPLRNRRSDIPELVNFFVDHYGLVIGKKISSVSTTAMNQLIGHTWPGNIRELSHVIERGVLLAKDGIVAEVRLPKVKDNDQANLENEYYVKSFDENERDHILNVLRKCFGRVSGDGGAAELLKVPPTTLASKIKRLGILRKHISPED